MKRQLKKIINPRYVQKFRLLLESVDNSIIPFFARSRFLSSVYYCLFNQQFSREHQAVLKGRIAYQRSLTIIKKSSVLLRRNTHRLEKGLIMQPPRDLFATAYIAETVQCYIKCTQQSSICSQELKWATDVLTEYFSVIKPNKDISVLQKEFEQISLQSTNQTRFIPYQQSTRTPLLISDSQLEQLFIYRRSVRWYAKKTVNKALVNRAVSLASLAPSACNRQPFEFYYLQGDDAVTIAKYAMGTSGFADNVPALFVVVGDLAAYPAERDKHVIYIDAALASMQLMLSLETLGLSSCPINWPDIEFREQLIAKQLKLAVWQRPIMLISTGYAAEECKIAYSQKKNAKQLLKEVKL